ncbi:MAG TPA: hypothetical protein VFT91_04605, partial [Dehalococcoidia bacterium]|nr:hypothetical protein [Dehalococcoidia bacterium]
MPQSGQLGVRRALQGTGPARAFAAFVIALGLIVLAVSLGNALFGAAPKRAEGAGAGTAGPAAVIQQTPLDSNDFVLSASQGFGDRQNSVMWSMKWFKGKLYVGTNRSWLCWSYASFVTTVPFLSYLYPPRDPDTVCPADINDLPLRAEIWAWTPGATVADP